MQVTCSPGFVLNGQYADNNMAHDKSVHERRFEAAVKVMRSLPKDGTFEPSDDMLVMFYSYYKQATVGPCNTTKPNGWDSFDKAKWEAWKALGEMTTEEAMKEYVQEIQLILETIPLTEEVAELLDELDPFYEVVEDEDEDEEVTKKPATLATERSDEEEEEGDEEIGSLAEEEEELEDIPEDVRRSAVFKEAERGSVLVCNGSADTHSASSITNGTHSSLNTEEEEEELVCSTEDSLDPSELYTCADHMNDDVIEQKLQREDSDNDVYSDSVEHQAARKGSGASSIRLAGPGTVGAKRPEELGGSQDGNQQEVLLHGPVASGPVRSERALVNTDRGESSPPVSGQNVERTGQICSTAVTLSDREVVQRVRAGPVVRKHSVNTQICTALSRLQEDMQSLLQRLKTLETAAQAEILPPKCEPHSASAKKRFHWWPLNLSPITVALALFWPFAVHWLVQLYLLKRRRRIR